MKKDPVFRMLLVYTFFAALLILFAFMCSSCEVLKTKQDKKQETAAETKEDSGSVKKTNSASVTDWEWWRTILKYAQPVKGGDTTINNFITVPQGQQQQPQIVILEGGKGKEQTNTQTYDSTWDKRFARMEQIVTESTKTKATKPATLTQLILLAIGAIVVSVFLSKLKIGFK